MATRFSWETVLGSNRSSSSSSSSPSVPTTGGIDPKDINEHYHLVQEQVAEHKVDMTQLNSLAQKVHSEIQHETLYLSRIINEALSEELKAVSELQSEIAKLQRFRTEFDNKITRELMQIMNECNLISEKLVAMSRATVKDAKSELTQIDGLITKIDSDITNFTADIKTEEASFKTLKTSISAALKSADLSEKIMKSSYDITGEIITKSQTLLTQITSTRTDLLAFRNMIHSNREFK